MATGLVFHEAYLRHQNPPGHPERVERLEAIHAGLERSGLLARVTRVTPVPATDEDLARVHTPAHIAAVEQTAGRDGNFDGDTYFSAGSAAAARLAAGGTVDLVRRIYRGELANGVALVRPPGHHAEAAAAMGFCLYNNVAVAAQALLSAGARKVAIFDWDVHHGNGTQHSFEADPRVLYLSTHQWPFYPGTGAADETGRGEGAGATVNVPLPGGCGDAEYLRAVDEVVAPILEQHAPDVVLVSAGFDAYEDDPLASMRVTTAGFAELARRMRAVADRVCGGKLMYVLEGGYDLTGLSAGVNACVADLLVPQAPAAAPPLGERSKWPDVRARVQRIQKPFWKLG
jgi:acetoin utilization deacetylase AcuC-like enzyme